MGHHHSHSHGAYEALQKRLVQKVQGAVESPLLLKILGMLFSPEDADLVRRLPHNFTSVEALSKNLAIPTDELNGRLTELARRGVVFDIDHDGKRYCMLPPVMIGLFEFTFMRARPDMPMKELAKLFEEYLGDHDFIEALVAGKTQQARTLVHEENIPQDAHTEVLDWERATKIIASASATAVGLCQCHSAAQHTGHACDRPQEVCLTLNFGAESLVRNGIARAITKDEALKILRESKEAGLVQSADNVQRKVTFICNCCKCCCHIMRSIRALDPAPNVVTSNFVSSIDVETCDGCGVCVEKCPVDAIAIESRGEGSSKKEWAVRDEGACLGCGVCATVCATDAARMVSRPQRVLVPEDAFEQRVMMAIERGKLANLVFDDPEKLSHRALSRIIGALERSKPAKAWLGAQSLNSSFLKQVVKAAKKQSGGISEVIS